MSLLCYNKGCGKEFDPETNTDTSCLYHPGVPVFHEGMKGWSCCPKKYTDFQEFLGAQGCTAGKHTNTKPTPPAQQSNSGTVTVIGSGNGNGSEKNIPDSKSTSTPTPTPVPTPVPTAAPLSNVPFVWEKSADPLVKLPVVVSDAVRAAGQPTSSATTTSTTTATAAATTTTTTEQQNENVIPPVGTVCVRNACGKAYENESSLQQDCVHHPGTPVFHEGSKFWSCCKKRTLDFDEFMSQKGCTTGKHLWFKPKTAEQVQCRYDWYQMGGDVLVNIYAKKVNCDASFIEVNKSSLNVHIIFETNKEFNLTVDLAGYIDPAQSQVQILGSKVEIKLKKVDGSAWQNLTQKQ